MFFYREPGTQEAFGRQRWLTLTALAGVLRMPPTNLYISDHFTKPLPSFSLK